MQKYKVKIKANKIFPFYMQHRMDDLKLEEWEKKRGRIIERDDVSKEDVLRAEFHCYRNNEGKLFIPVEHIRSSMIEAGKYIKAKVGNSKRSMTNIVAGMFFVRGSPETPEELPIKQEYDIDKRSAVNNAIKARIITVRPKWKDWETEFELLIDNDTITQETVKNIIEYAGRYVGTGSYRPQHKGNFGRFEIESFEKVE